MGLTTVASFLLGLSLAQDLSPVELQRKASEQRLAARYTEAETLYSKALVLLDREHPPDSAILLSVLDGLALLHLGLNRLEKAQSLSLRAVTLIDNVDGLSAASTLAVRGAVLQASGDLPGAMECFRRSLAIRESMLGVDDGLTLDVRTQIAALTQLQGKTQEAIGLYRSILAGYEGRRDARNASFVMDNLARLLAQSKRYTEAESLYRRAVAQATQLLGERHPNTAAAQSALGVFLLDRKRIREAEPFLRAALASDLASLPDGHPRIATGQLNLSTLLLKRNPSDAEARALLEQCIPVLERNWGDGDRRTLLALDQYAALLRLLREFALAGEVEAKSTRVRVQHALHSR